MNFAGVNVYAISKAKSPTENILEFPLREEIELKT